MINLNRIKTSSNLLNKYVDPRDIFSLLPKDKYTYLRGVQQEVLDEWNRNRDKEFNIIKMNTGSGKTLVSLLILISLMNENKGNAVYVVPDQFLVEQVKKQAEELNIPVCDSYDNISFMNNKSILITTIKTLVNGKSVFGMRENNNKSIDNIIIDDVHSCLSTIEEQCKVTIPNTCSAYNDIYNIFKNDLMNYRNTSAYMLEDEITSMRSIIIPYWIWSKKISNVKECLNKYKDQDFFTFNYQLIKDNLNLVRCFFRGGNIEIIPYCIPIDKIRSYVNAKHKIFLSATIPDDTIFSSVLNIPEEKINIVTPLSASDIGERMILFPELHNPLIKTNDICMKIKSIAQNINVLVIVPSKYKAQKWEEYADLILTSDNLGEGIKKIKHSNNGLYVLINKYDGIDLPNDECRLIVLDTLPGLYNAFDSFEKSCMQLSKRINMQLIQKLEQGMGRGVRSNSDYCCIMLMGHQLIDLIFNNNAKTFFSIATQKQINLSALLWEQMSNLSLDSILENFELVLNRDEEWKEMSRDILVDCKYNNNPNIDCLQLAIRKAYNEAVHFNYTKAVTILEEYKNKISNKDEIGFVKMLIAEYVNNYDKAKSQEILLSAYRDNPYILKPLEGIEYSKIIHTANQCNNITEQIAKFDRLEDYIIKVHSVLDNLVFEPDTSEIFEASIKDIFCLLGFNSQRPEKEFNEGPDNLVRIGDNKFFIIECKNGSTASIISKSDSGQLNESISWFKLKYGDYSYVPILIHCSNVFSANSSPDQSTKIMTEYQLSEFLKSIKNFLTELSANSQNVTQNIHRLIKANNLDEKNIETFFVCYKKE